MRKGIWVLIVAILLLVAWQMLEAKPYISAAGTVTGWFLADSLTASGDTSRVRVDIDELMDLSDPHHADTSFFGSAKVKAFIRKYESLKGQPSINWSIMDPINAIPDSGVMIIANISQYPVTLDSIAIWQNKVGIADTLGLKIQRRKYYGSEPDSVFYLANTGWDSVGYYVNTVEGTLSDVMASDEILWLEKPSDADSTWQLQIKIHYHIAN